MTKPRLPPTWLVLLPALALAAVGARAVLAEMRASQDAARDRARSVASRLARSVDALVAEYAAPLPKDGEKLTDAQFDAAWSHLEPRFAFYVPHADELPDWPHIKEYMAGGLVGRAPAVSTPSRATTFPQRDADLVHESLTRARAIADSPGGETAAASLLAATCEVLGEKLLAWPLRREEARLRMRLGDRDGALAALAAASSQGGLIEFEGVAFPDAALVTAAEIVSGGPSPEWLTATYGRLLLHPTLVREDVLHVIERLLGDELPERLRAERRMSAAARELAPRSVSTPIQATRLRAERGGPELSLWRSFEGRSPSIYCGVVPASVVRDRLVGEAGALAGEAGVVGLRLTTLGGDHVLDTAGAVGHAREFVVETVPLVDPSLATWRAEAVVAPETGVPATAWLLGAAVVATTIALLVGMVALRRAAERSARLAEDRRTFLDHVAHELRTPAAAVQALSEELSTGTVPSEREPQYRMHLLRESRRLAGLVDDTLDFARLDAGRLSFKPTPADLRDVVAAAIEESDGAGRVVAHIPQKPVVRPVDAPALRRAVKNLVENAVRHGGGDAPVDVTLEASNGHVAIVVADKGRGIAPEHLPRIFERFWRAPSSTHETKGVGLGLALCREVARAHGGDVEVASEPGKGSTFTLRMPSA